MQPQSKIYIEKVSEKLKTEAQLPEWVNKGDKKNNLRS